MFFTMPRLVVIVMLAAALIGITPVTASAASGPSKAEINYCSTKEYGKLAKYDHAVKRGGKSYKNIGFIRMYARPSPSNPSDIRVCTRTIHGSTTNNIKLPTTIKIGSYKGSGKPTWHYTSSGSFANSTKGVALTPGSGRKPILYASIVYKGKTYSVTVKPRGYQN